MYLKTKLRLFFIVLTFNIIYSQTSFKAPSALFTDEYFGVKILDEYRNLEDLHNPEVINWMKNQTDFTNSVLNKIPNKDYYLNKRLELEKRQGYFVSDLKITKNDQYFYMKRNADEKFAKVYYKIGVQGKEELLYDPVTFKSSFNKKELKNTQQEFIVNMISPSWDGSRVAISLSEKGKELSEVIIIDVKTKNVHPQIITHTNPSNIGWIKWLSDNSGFFYVYYPEIDPKSKLFAKNTKTILYRIGEDPNQRNDVFSRDHNPELDIPIEKYPSILAFNEDDDYYLSMLVDAEDYRTAFIIDKKDLLKGKKNWRTLYGKEDKVYYVRLANEYIYFLSGYNSPNYKLCRTLAKKPDFENPEVLIPERKDEVIKSYAITRDGIYYTTAKNGIEAKLYIYKNNKDKPIKLPYVSGNVNLQIKGKEFKDIWITCSGWAHEEQRYRYDLDKDSFFNENLVPTTSYPEFENIVVEETTVKSEDGEDIPLSLIYNKNLPRNGNAPLLMYGYGAYGESIRPFFARSYLLWANQGGVFAIAHVRGGGEKGKIWHEEGQKMKKNNSWKDLISCTEYLINEKYSSPGRIGLWGQSAGGILMGRAITERPDLFKAAILEVGTLNTLRIQYNGIGGTDADEFGNIKDYEGFKALLEMDAYHHIKKGIKYPSTLIITGINDTRVAPWQSTKFAAKLLANNSSDNPTLLKVNYDSGHGIEDPVYKIHERNSLIFAFAFWQLGHPDYQPKENTNK
ncbi:prolyl oligopeptidase family serine peptidase [Chryseobacterium sp.]|uniref:prolyl oligopeptidase family serine peptidase n=1 Tax=Chryseobacterium sp. TaxID=1871047 RepID=UPI0025C4048B|nr:prolyl oligopeptidase family serine peptidase [Chryseobacterium sp.]